ncbi:serine hydrolase domain-containing protein [Dactylosporangium sp. CA-139066]|uniref:serine hydrolase domain-containing protein n=1 Tax=Dactylosporangium sp. CA-139066 TaxID=3239930 RepID=UPI003D8B781D
MDLPEFVRGAAEEFRVPGVAAGVLLDGTDIYACHGVTSVENPLPVDPDTLFLLGSVTKTYTATALVRLAAQRRVDLDAPVREYVTDVPLPGFTVAQLLNHTAGLDWNVIGDTGDGDDALARFVARLAAAPLIAEPGARASYSQGGYNLAGRVVERVTGQPFERAVAELLLEPIGLAHSSFRPEDVMTRRFAVGHDLREDGTATLARPWRPGGRGNNPGGGLASSVADQLRWARFHLGDGGGLLPAEALHGMRRATVPLPGSSLGDALGICWFLRDIDGAATIGHGGSSMGQFADLLIVPERGFAVVALSNANPTGTPCNRAIIRWALEHYLGVVERDPQPEPYDAARAGEVAAVYGNKAMTLTIGADLMLDVRIRPEIRAASEIELPADHEPAPIGLLGGDNYIVTAGGLQGQRGFFTRDAAGTVTGIDLAGRLFRRE